MPKYMMIFHGGGRPAPEDADRVMAAWTTWMNDLGDALIDGGNPAGPSMTVTANGVEEGGGANPVSGYSLINAPDMATATKMAQGCPILEGGAGTVEVAEALEM